MSRLLRVATLLLAGTFAAGPAAAQAPVIAKAKISGACAAPGSTIQLLGTGLGNPNLYEVGVKKTPGTLTTTAWSNNSISAVAPSSASEVTVQVALKQGSSWKSNAVGVRLCGSWSPGDMSHYQAPSSQPDPGDSNDIPSPSSLPLAKKGNVAKKPGAKTSARPAGGPAGLRPLAAVRPSGFGPASARRASDEIVVLLRSSTARITSTSSTRVERHALDALGLALEIRQPTAGNSTDDAIRELRRLPAALVVDRNDRLELLADERSDPRRYATRLTAWNPETCGGGARVGIIDTGVDEDHAWLTGARIRSRAFTKTPSRVDHGTAVAGLLVGAEHGLVPRADLYVAAAVARESGGDARAAIAPVVRAFDWLVGERVAVINVSLGGERNQVLEEVVRRVLDEGAAVVAAAGNGGPKAAPVHPAAQEGVIAVAALDARRKVWRSSNRGAYVDLAAPGVDLWVARPDGEGVFLSGTSFAAPFVSAALAVVGADQHAVLYDAAVDLGAPGPDPVYGRGMLQSPAACAAPTATAEGRP